MLCMPILSDIVARNFRRIRQDVAGTQEAWEAMTGMPQGTVSRFERGRGLTVLTRLEEWVEAAGADPRELFVLDERDAGSAELLDLWRTADDEDKALALGLLRRARRLRAKVRQDLA